MNVRPFEIRDEAALLAIYSATDYHQKPLPDLTQTLLSRVVVDADDKPLMAAYMKLIPEGTLICQPGGSMHPLVKLSAIGMLHEVLRDDLVKMGYDEAIASIPPQLERNYARHLTRHLNWQESWKTYRVLDAINWRRA